MGQSSRLAAGQKYNRVNIIWYKVPVFQEKWNC